MRSLRNFLIEYESILCLVKIINFSYHLYYFSIDQKKPPPSVVNFLVGRQFVAVVAKLSLKQQSVININLKLFSKRTSV